VDLVRLVAPGAVGFANAVMRRVSERDLAAWLAAVAPSMADDAVGHLALVHAHPEWMVRAFAEALSGDLTETAEALATATAPLSGRDERWLDLCAGPGGKAALLGAMAAQRGAHVTAVEVASHRAQLVYNTTAGLPVTVIRTDGRDVGVDEDLPEGGFDRVLVDAPCTGLGSLRRRPESRWRRQPSDLPPLTQLQRELLTAALRAVRPGGLVVYATCSPHVVETKVTVRETVRRQESTVELVDIRPILPDGVPMLGDGPTVQLWPHRHGTDAMFMALLRRSE
jgi:16S rRNA (cytosine967-C5)-methyltransferase